MIRFQQAIIGQGVLESLAVVVFLLQRPVGEGDGLRAAGVFDDDEFALRITFGNANRAFG